MQVDFKIRLDKKILNACTCTHAHTKPDMLVHVRHPSAAMVKREVEAGVPGGQRAMSPCEEPHSGKEGLTPKAHVYPHT